jgi:hypothetical protein
LVSLVRLFWLLTKKRRINYGRLRKIITIALTVALTFTPMSSVIVEEKVLASDVLVNESVNNISHVSITDVDTGKVWEFEVDSSDIKTLTLDSTSMTRSSMLSKAQNAGLSKSSVDALNEALISASSEGEAVTVGICELNVDVGEYLDQVIALSGTSLEKTLKDDIWLTTGFTYTENASGNKIAFQSIYGSYTLFDYYTAQNTKVIWNHPLADDHGEKYPGTSSWSYPGNGVYAGGTPSLIFSTAQTTITIPGMGGSKTISITCTM